VRDGRVLCAHFVSFDVPLCFPILPGENHKGTKNTEVSTKTRSTCRSVPQRASLGCQQNRKAGESAIRHSARMSGLIFLAGYFATITTTSGATPPLDCAMSASIPLATRFSLDDFGTSVPVLSPSAQTWYRKYWFP
jgi:hypothetical protein